MPVNKTNKKTGRIKVKPDTHKLIKWLSVEKEMCMGDLIECAIPYLQANKLEPLPKDILENIKKEMSKN
jgi:hypothetical protein